MYASLIRSMAGSALSKTGAGALLKGAVLAGMMGTLARLHYFPRASVTGYTSWYDGYLGSSVDYTGVPTDVKEFVVSAINYVNYFNAFEAGVAWADAPWADYPSSSIPVRQDDSLVQLGHVIGFGWV
jgi:hypothetical protein